MIYKRFVNGFRVSNICMGTWNLSPSTKNLSHQENFQKKTKELIQFAIKKRNKFF